MKQFIILAIGVFFYFDAQAKLLILESRTSEARSVISTYNLSSNTYSIIYDGTTTGDRFSNIEIKDSSTILALDDQRTSEILIKEINLHTKLAKDFVRYPLNYIEAIYMAVVGDGVIVTLGGQGDIEKFNWKGERVGTPFFKAKSTSCPNTRYFNGPGWVATYNSSANQIVVIHSGRILNSYGAHLSIISNSDASCDQTASIAIPRPTYVTSKVAYNALTDRYFVPYTSSSTYPKRSISSFDGKNIAYWNEKVEYEGPYNEDISAITSGHDGKIYFGTDGGAIYELTPQKNGPATTKKIVEKGILTQGLNSIQVVD